MQQKLGKALQNQQGVALMLVLCISAVLLSLTAALLFAASQLTASANRQLLQEQCYRLARTFSQQLEAELVTPADNPAAGTLQGYLKDTLLNEAYSNRYSDGRAYSYKMKQQTPDDYGDITVTLEKATENRESINEIYQTSNQDTLLKRIISMDSQPDRRDYTLKVTVTVTLEDVTYAYTQSYQREARYGLRCTVGGVVCEWDKNQSELGFNISGGAKVPLREGDAVTVSYDYANPTEILYTKLQEEG